MNEENIQHDIYLLSREAENIYQRKIENAQKIELLGKGHLEASSKELK